MAISLTKSMSPFFTDGGEITRNYRGYRLVLSGKHDQVSVYQDDALLFTKKGSMGEFRCAELLSDGDETYCLVMGQVRMHLFNMKGEFCGSLNTYMAMMQIPLCFVRLSDRTLLVLNSYFTDGEEEFGIILYNIPQMIHNTFYYPIAHFLGRPPSTKPDEIIPWVEKQGLVKFGAGETDPDKIYLAKRQTPCHSGQDQEIIQQELKEFPQFLSSIFAKHNVTTTEETKFECLDLTGTHNEPLMNYLLNMPYFGDDNVEEIIRLLFPVECYVRNDVQFRVIADGMHQLTFAPKLVPSSENNEFMKEQIDFTGAKYVMVRGGSVTYKKIE